MDRYVCIHAHFYQPPRENPWLEAIEMQDSAYPFHDWNERIAAECYEPNAEARILDREGRIREIANNYSRISFNFGPTLLSWLETRAPTVYRAVLDAQRESRKAFSGHGSALAQAYTHLILPLANERDRRTQVRWGLADFAHRFQSPPEGMWLPEAAVDLATLEELAQAGIRFTVLAPYQAARVRPRGATDWEDVSGQRVNPRMPYEIRLPSGRTMALFFYDGPISRAIAFEDLLTNAEKLTGRLLGAFTAQDGPQLVHIATDGETYGHHKPFGDMALAWTLDHLAHGDQVRLTNYGEYLERFPPTHEVEIFERTSWSCAHGVERWRADCGCNSGGRPGWNQAWRAPLREALDFLRDALAQRFSELGAQLLADPWAARDEYVSVILDRSPDNVQRFLEQHASVATTPANRSRILRLLEMQRHALLMYTSCGWFFDELSGIETVQVIQYAGRALQLAQELGTGGLEERFLERLQQAKSNLPEHGDGRAIYERWVKPAAVDLAKVVAHYAVSSVFTPHEPRQQVYCYTIDSRDQRVTSLGNAKLVVGRAHVTSEVTHDSDHVTYGVLHLGGHNVSGGVRGFQGEEAYEALVREVTGAFNRADLAETIRVVDRSFGSNTWSLRLMFRDEQRAVLASIMKATLAEAETVYRRVYEVNAPLMRFLADLGIPEPPVLHVAAGFALNASLRRALEAEDLDLTEIQALMGEAHSTHVTLDAPGLSWALGRTIERQMARQREKPADLTGMSRLDDTVSLAARLPLNVDLRRVQNGYFQMLKAERPEYVQLAERGVPEAQEWLRRFDGLGGKLRVKVP